MMLASGSSVFALLCVVICPDVEEQSSDADSQENRLILGANYPGIPWQVGAEILSDGRLPNRHQ